MGFPISQSICSHNITSLPPVWWCIMLSVNIYWYRYRLIQSCDAYKLSATSNQHNPSKHNAKSPSNPVHKALSPQSIRAARWFRYYLELSGIVCRMCARWWCLCRVSGKLLSAKSLLNQFHTGSDGGKAGFARETRLAASFGKHFSNFCVPNTHSKYFANLAFLADKKPTETCQHRKAQTHSLAHTQTHTQQSLGKLFLFSFFSERRNKCKSHREKSFLICRNYYQSVIFDMSVGRKLPESCPLSRPLSPTVYLEKSTNNQLSALRIYYQ